MKKYFLVSPLLKPIIISYKGLSYQNEPFYKYRISGDYTLKSAKKKDEFITLGTNVHLYLHPLLFKNQIISIVTYLNLKGINRFLAPGLNYSYITEISVDPYISCFLKSDTI